MSNLNKLYNNYVTKGLIQDIISIANKLQDSYNLNAKFDAHDKKRIELLYDLIKELYFVTSTQE